MWRHGASASLGILLLASPALATHPDSRQQASISIRIGSDRAYPRPQRPRFEHPRYERPRYEPPRIELPRVEPPRADHPRRPEPPPVFVPHFTNLSTRTQIDGRWVIVKATVWRDECGRWNARAAVLNDDRCEAPEIFSASLAVKSDRRWWRTGMDRASCEPRAQGFAAEPGPNWGCDGDARVCVHLVTSGGRHMIQWDDVRVD